VNDDADTRARKRAARLRETRGVIEPPSPPLVNRTGRIRQPLTPGRRLEARMRELQKLSLAERDELAADAAITTTAMTLLRELEDEEEGEDWKGMDDDEEE
jgi:hypothetical protein